jgi:hypothetical protein
MVDGLHLQNRTVKPLVVALSGLKGRDGGGNLTNVQCKPIWNSHNELLLYNEYILI